ncbi:MAG: GAF domain-containing protein [Alphaproteobacteria bacterium]|nr:GAF domain-containing protein [Alphaproteobacteria bacterium]MCB9691665.1 GAF domain-containing protein [Alphaproteobacteria bacterium]
MASFSVSSRGLPTVEVEAPNWVAALGLGLHELGKGAGMERLACELLPNGTVIARDIKSGMGFVVQAALEPADDDELIELDDLEPLTEEVEERDDPRSLLEAIESADSTASAASLALTLARELVPCESGAVILEDRGYLRFVSVVGPHARRLIGVRLPAGTGVAGFAIEKQRIVVLDAAHEDPRHCGEVDALTGYTTEQILVVPVKRPEGGGCHGVVELMNLPVGQRFGTEQIAKVKSVARALAERLDQDR